MLPWAMRRRSASGVMSTSSIWSARAHDRVGHRLPLVDAGDPLDDVVERLEVLDVDRGDDVDARVEQLVDVLPALLVAAAGHVGVGELVDERDRRPAGEDGVDVHLLERRCRGTSTCARGTISRSPICAAVRGRPWVSTKPTTTSVPRAGGAGPRRAWRRSCRRRERRRGTPAIDHDPSVSVCPSGAWCPPHPEAFTGRTSRRPGGR